MGLIPERPRLTHPAAQETAPMPVTHEELRDYFDNLPTVKAGIYVNPGPGGVMIATIYDDAGNMIREDHIVADHFDPETYEALARWAAVHARGKAIGQLRLA